MPITHISIFTKFTLPLRFFVFVRHCVRITEKDAKVVCIILVRSNVILILRFIDIPQGSAHADGHPSSCLDFI